MRAYISRPFGTKNGVDFDNVEANLIRPALAQLGIDPASSSEFSTGDIQSAVFVELATTDLVVADISGTNPSVQFELGVRYTARQRFTVLIRHRRREPDAAIAPFHLRQLRCLEYDPENPSASISELVNLISERIKSKRTDSPVYVALPNLKPPSLPELTVAPPSFRDEVARAAETRDAGSLALLATECDTFPWRLDALRLVAREQFNIRDFVGAQKSLEAVRSSDLDDVGTNALLGTIYDRLGKSMDARMALDRVLASPSASQSDRAEALALTGRNLKSEWVELWRNAKLEDPGLKALRSPLLKASRDAYLRAYKEDLNHFYSGLNALALTQVQLQLAQKYSREFQERFEDEEECTASLKREEQLAASLTGAVGLSLASAADYAERKGIRDPWIQISLADLTFLTSKRATRVARMYEDALSAAPAFARTSVGQQLRIYTDLGIFQETVQSVLDLIGQAPYLVSTSTGLAIARVLLFTGHMVDWPGRSRPRFPADRENDARRAIEQAIEAEKLEEGTRIGMAGGCNGGDILFHEVCLKRQIPTELYLPIPEEAYLAQSVLPAGGNWLARFKSLRKVAPVRVLQASAELPEWLRGKRNYSYWQRSNLWLLNNALVHRSAAVTLIALWNGEQGDEPGGAKDMVAQARTAGVKCVTLNSNQIFGLT